MSNQDLDDADNETIHVDEILADFNDELQKGEIPKYGPFLARCPEKDQKELCSLMNTLVLAERALRSLRSREE